MRWPHAELQSNAPPRLFGVAPWPEIWCPRLAPELFVPSQVPLLSLRLFLASSRHSGAVHCLGGCVGLCVWVRQDHRVSVCVAK